MKRSFAVTSSVCLTLYELLYLYPNYVNRANITYYLTQCHVYYDQCHNYVYTKHRLNVPMHHPIHLWWYLLWCVTVQSCTLWNEMFLCSSGVTTGRSVLSSPDQMCSQIHVPGRTSISRSSTSVCRTVSNLAVYFKRFQLYFIHNTNIIDCTVLSLQCSSNISQMYYYGSGYVTFDGE